MKELKHCRPEEAGVSSAGILKCLKSWEEDLIPVHSLMVLRHGKVVSEVYYEPVKKGELHRMYSETKSFTAVAIGCLIGNGIIRLNDSITKYFPEYLPDPLPEWVEQTTIKDMLEMQSCHSVTTYKTDWSKNWVKSFFTVKPDHAPGTVFSYDTSSSHTLCALVEKLTGKKMLDYLREKCLDEIGFSKEAYIREDPFGVSWGGSGLMATTEDMARFALLLMNKGKWEGKQLVPEWYMEEACDGHVPNLIHGDTPDDVTGYGYQIWKMRNGFACRGKGGQLAVCIPEKDLICITTADTTGIAGGSQKLCDGIFRYIAAAADSLEEGSDHVSEAAQKELEQYGRMRKLRPMEKRIDREKTCGSRISGNIYRIGTDYSPFEWVCTELYEGEGVLSYSLHGKKVSFQFGFDQLIEGVFPGYNQRYAASASWLKENILCIRTEILGEEPCYIRIQMVYEENSVTIHMVNTGELCFKEYGGWFYGTND